jgi:uncharacterized protein YgbK (DUF1537 family)
MIVVIADDLSGAAELGGIARRLGFTAEVQTLFTPAVPSRVVCVDSGTRALSPAAAAQRLERLIPQILTATPDWIYLKFDSVLRGNILSELRAALSATGLNRALLVTANPARGRIIRNGNCYVDGVPLHETSFASDPEHPRTTSSVRELLGEPSHGIATPDVEHPRQLAVLAEKTGPETVTAGAAEFFEALLRARRDRSTPALAAHELTVAASSPALAECPTALLVCGSLTAWPTRRREARERGVPSFDIYDAPTAISLALSNEPRVLVGIGDTAENRGIPPAALVAMLAEVGATVLATAGPGQLLVEGGATAAAIVRRLGWTRMVSLPGPDDGVGILQPLAPLTPLVLVKPGSYPWPARLW